MLGLSVGALSWHDSHWTLPLTSLVMADSHLCDYCIELQLVPALGCRVVQFYRHFMWEGSPEVMANVKLVWQLRWPACSSLETSFGALYQTSGVGEAWKGLSEEWS